MSDAPRDTAANEPSSTVQAVPGLGVVKDLCCMGCGYDLSGLAWTSCCPECAVSVETSHQSSVFGVGDLVHLKELSLGANLIWISAVLRFVVVAAGSVVVLALSNHIGGNVALALWGLAFVACLAVKACGCWLFTQPLGSSPKSQAWRHGSGLVYRVISIIEISTLCFGIVMVIIGGWPSMPLLIDNVLRIAFATWLLSLLAFNWYAISLMGKLRIQGPIGSPAVTWAVFLAVLVVLGPLFGVGLFVAAVLCWMHLEVILDRLKMIRKNLLQIDAKRGVSPALTVRTVTPAATGV